jgi:hypothetical protein
LSDKASGLVRVPYNLPPYCTRPPRRLPPSQTKFYWPH